MSAGGRGAGGGRRGDLGVRTRPATVSSLQRRQNLDAFGSGTINLRTLLKIGFQDEGENIRVLTDCKVPDSLY
jgi:hypothetical protein